MFEKSAQLNRPTITSCQIGQKPGRHPCPVQSVPSSGDNCLHLKLSWFTYSTDFCIWYSQFLTNRKSATCNWFEASMTSSARMSSGSLPMSVISRIRVFAFNFCTRDEPIEARVNMVWQIWLNLASNADKRLYTKQMYIAAIRGLIKSSLLTA